MAAQDPAVRDLLQAQHEQIGNKQRQEKAMRAERREFVSSEYENTARPTIQARQTVLALTYGSRFSDLNDTLLTAEHTMSHK